MSKQGVRPLSVVVGYRGTDETSHMENIHNASFSAL